MKTIQNLLHHQFTEKAIVLGDKIINIAAIIAVFVLLVLPFVCVNDCPVILKLVN